MPQRRSSHLNTQLMQRSCAKNLKRNSGYPHSNPDLCDTGAALYPIEQATQQGTGR